MARAFELAREADYRTSPNPMVGAVVLDANGAVAGEGYHQRKGAAHAEQLALAAAGERARGGTLIVNLEPCIHPHRTPCCVDAIAAAGIRRVVVSTEDPDERMRGRGVARLRAAGIEVAAGAMADQSRRLNEFYFKHRLTGRPFVTAKFAMSLDGKIATASGASRWITGEAARRHGHRLRHIHDAILVGVNTVRLDDPELSARDDHHPRQPVRIVLDSNLGTPAGSRVLGSRTILAATRAGSVEGAEVLVLPAEADGRVALRPLLDELGRRDILSVLVEGGAATHGSFFDAGLVDKVHAYVAPMIIGGNTAPSPIGGQGVEALADALRLGDVQITALDADIMISGYPDVHWNR